MEQSQEAERDRRIGEALVAVGLLDGAQLAELLAEQACGEAEGAPVRLAEMVVRRGLATREEVLHSLRGASSSRGLSDTAVPGSGPESEARLAAADATLCEEGPGAPFMAANFGKYAVLRLLGRGGMGEVFLARDPDLQRDVAIKTFHGGGSPNRRERFLREARAAARLRHPNIIGIHEVAPSAEAPYFVMDAVSGTPLSRWLAGKAPAEVAALLEKAARAVDFAHGKGILHRDLKPDNVIVEGSTGEPIVLDFGLAGDLGGEESGEERLTREGVVLGTPEYMPPEQAAGHREAMGPHSDVYSLGVMLYEGLTGRLPFRGENLLELVSHILQDPPEPPSRLRPEVPAALDEICARALAKTPGERYASAAAFADDLRAFLAAPPKRAEPPQRPYAILLAAALALLLGIAWAAHALREGPQDALARGESALGAATPGDGAAPVDSAEGATPGERPSPGSSPSAMPEARPPGPEATPTPPQATPSPPEDTPSPPEATPTPPEPTPPAPEPPVVPVGWEEIDDLIARAFRAALDPDEEAGFQAYLPLCHPDAVDSERQRKGLRQNEWDRFRRQAHLYLEAARSEAAPVAEVRRPLEIGEGTERARAFIRKRTGSGLLTPIDFRRDAEGAWRISMNSL